MSKSECKYILVVEDDSAIRETLKFALELKGYSVLAAANGVEALAELEKVEHTCLILLDLMMPIMNGWEFVEAKSKIERFSQIPVIVITAFSEQSQSIRAEGVLKKPLNLDLLFEVVKKWCG